MATANITNWDRSLTRPHANPCSKSMFS